MANARVRNENDDAIVSLNFFLLPLDALAHLIRMLALRLWALFYDRLIALAGFCAQRQIDGGRKLLVAIVNRLFSPFARFAFAPSAYCAATMRRFFVLFLFCRRLFACQMKAARMRMHILILIFQDLRLFTSTP